MSAIDFLPITTTVLSTDTGNPVRFSVTNKSSSPLTIYWIDRSGNETAYGTISTGQTYNQTTSSSHAWEVKGADGKVAFKFLPTVAGNITVEAGYSNTFSDFSEKIIQTADGTWSTAQGYGLINVAKSLGVDDLGGTLSLNGKSNNLALNAISASSAWAAGYTGKDVKVAVIDIGIASHDEINSNIVGGYDFYDKDTTPTPAAGAYQDHALGAASIIAGSHAAHSGADTMGVAPDAKLLNVRVGSTTGSSSTNIASGIRWAVDNGAKVICMPLQSSASDPDQVVVSALDYAFQHNVVCVVIGGNYSNYGPTGPALAALQLKGEIIDVGNFNAMASTPFDSSNMAGATPFPWVMASSSGYVPTAAGGYAYHEDGGTSFAGPYVAGLAALLWEQNPKATATEIINKILGGASLAGVDIAPSQPSTGITQADLTKAVNEAVAATKVADALAAAADAAIAKAAADAALTKAVHDALATAGQSQPEVHIAASKNFTFTNGSKSDLFVGIDGTDTLVYSASRANVTVARAGDHFAVTDKVGGAIDMLYNVDRLQFSDVSIALDVSGAGVGGGVYRLYQAAFNRAPDKAGLGFWMAAMDAGRTLTEVAQGFVQSAEFQKLYGANPSNNDLVAAMYNNVLHRAPDAAGLKFWVDALEHGETAKGLLTAFSDSPENQAAAAKIIGQGFEYTPFH